MRSTETRLTSLEKGSTNRCPVFRMSIGESEADARTRHDLPVDAAVLFIQRVIIRSGGLHARH